VFPGGKVDPVDSDWADRLDRDPRDLHALLGEPQLQPQQAAGLFVTAIREVFEETGLLFADLAPAQARAAWEALRTGPRFDKLLAPLGVRLAASALQPWSRWITPTLGSLGRKRFDTRFFVAGVPAGQDPAHDAHEATASLWIMPGEALRTYWEGGMTFAPPQIMSLCHLARHDSVASVLAQARGRRPPLIQPQPHENGGVRTLCYPGDPGHPESERALPGPTRLHWRNRRFEPDAGLDILLRD
jgi:8-oxo-dGTP pyrophosphatase MutT (NUDIX family)